MEFEGSFPWSQTIATGSDMSYWIHTVAPRAVSLRHNFNIIDSSDIRSMLEYDVKQSGISRTSNHNKTPGFHLIHI
jgi:hypothetical protein